MSELTPLIIPLVLISLSLAIFFRPKKKRINFTKLSRNRYGGMAEYTDTTRTLVHKGADRD